MVQVIGDPEVIRRSMMREIMDVLEVGDAALGLDELYMLAAKRDEAADRLLERGEAIEQAIGTGEGDGHRVGPCCPTLRLLPCPEGSLPHISDDRLHRWTPQDGWYCLTRDEVACFSDDALYAAHAYITTGDAAPASPQ
ncbi:hypothetical protein LCGC14_0824930 [marine sediment metagenome]|uniref:Uncharacterized protein n=1 Tax=marine sediment metagenome TaxID=412755 RepID=A0A0F9SQA2_9ZZZZ